MVLHQDNSQPLDHLQEFIEEYPIVESVLFLEVWEQFVVAVVDDVVVVSRDTHQFQQDFELLLHHVVGILFGLDTVLDLLDEDGGELRAMAPEELDDLDLLSEVSVEYSEFLLVSLLGLFCDDLGYHL